MSARKPNTEPIPGYRLIEPLGKGGFGEVWKCEAPGGLIKAIKFVNGNGGSLVEGRCPSSEELRAIQRVKDLRHPFLLSIERIEVCRDELVIVMELADRSLHDLLEERLGAGEAGLARDEVLAYLEEAAEVLDLMNFEYGLQHLDVKPRNLFLVRGHVKVADFGLVQSLSETTRAGEASQRGESMHLSMVTPLYAAPELFQNQISERCDQYSLAIAYQELLSGTRPIDGKNVRQLMMQHTVGVPNLEPLPEHDRPIIARALAKNPTERYGSCTALVLALVSAGQQELSAVGSSAEAAAASGTRVIRPRSTSTLRARSTTETKGHVSLAATRNLGPAEARVLPDFNFLSCVARDPRSETWQAQTAEGRKKLVHLLYGVGGTTGTPPQEVIRHLQGLRHPALLPTTVVPAGRGSLILVTDLVETTLRHRFQEYLARGEAGIARGELLDRLEQAAEALDQLYQQKGLQHLELNPSRILLSGERVLLDQMGVAQLLWEPSGVPCSQVQSLYNAPERAQGLLTRSSDQFSLGVIFQEMLTGKHPFRKPTKYGATLSKDKALRDPDLQALPVPDRLVVARALDANPERRFASCLDFIRALRSAGRQAARVEEAEGDDPERTARRQVIALLVEEAREWLQLQSPEAPQAEVPPEDGRPVLEQRLVAVLPPEGALKKFDSFRQQWDARLSAHGDTFANFLVSEKKGSWLPWRNRQATLRVEIHWTRPTLTARRMPEVRIRVSADNPSCEASAALLPQLGPLLVESLQTNLLGSPERRNGERILWPHPVSVCCASPGLTRSPAVASQGKDLSLTGMGLFMPVALPSSQVQLRLSSPGRSECVTLPGSIVRIQRWDEKLYEVGVLFE